MRGLWVLMMCVGLGGAAFADVWVDDPDFCVSCEEPALSGKFSSGLGADVWMEPVVTLHGSVGLDEGGFWHLSEFPDFVPATGPGWDMMARGLGVRLGHFTADELIRLDVARFEGDVQAWNFVHTGENRRAALRAASRVPTVATVRLARSLGVSPVGRTLGELVAEASLSGN